MQWNKLNPILLQYSRQTPPATLLRHHRIARYIIYLLVFSSVTGISALALGLAFGFSTIDLCILVAFSILTLLLMIPGIFCIFWLSEIEANLTERSISLPASRTTHQRVHDWAMRMVFWGALAVLLPVLVRYIQNKN